MSISNKKHEIIKTDLNKVLNSNCSCGTALLWVKTEVIMLEPCEHLIHDKCFKKLKTNKCPYCKSTVSGITRKNDYKKNPDLYQKCIDITSMTNFDNMSSYDAFSVFENFPVFLSVIGELFVAYGKKAGSDLIENILSMNDTNVHVTGLNKIKSGPKVFISNHTSHLDFLVLFYVLKSGYLASASVYENFLTRRLTEIIPLLVIDRSKKGENTVEKMKKYIEEKGSICLFPEGMITHPNALIKFRTGAFNVGYPVYPIVLKYDPVLGDMSTPNFMIKVASQQKVNVSVMILDPFYPPFDDNKIEEVRLAMANAGDLLLSRVSNRDIKEVQTNKK